MLQKSSENVVELVEGLVAGNASAFKQLYDQYETRLYRFAFGLVQDREEAEEVVQEVFVKLWESRLLLDPQQHFDGYLFRIARNLVYNKARRRVYETAFSKYLAEYGTFTENETEATMAHQELEQLLEETCAALPPVRRQVFVMSRMEGLSNSEIAAALNTSTSNIENHIYKALKTIKEKLRMQG